MLIRRLLQVIPKLRSLHPALSLPNRTVHACRPLATMGDEIPHVFPPSKLGEYTVISEIAEGTFGKVKSTYFRASYPPLRPDTYPPLQWPFTPSPVTRSQ